MFCPKCSRQYLEGEQECTECKVPFMEKTGDVPIIVIRFLLLSLLCLVFSFLGLKIANPSWFGTVDTTVGYYITGGSFTIAPWSYVFFDNLVSFYSLCVILGILIFAVFLYNDWENLFVLPGAWLLNILYVYSYCDHLSTFGLFGLEDMSLKMTIYLVLPNLIYSLILAVIYWRIKKNEKYIFRPKLLGCKFMQCFLLSLICFSIFVGCVEAFISIASLIFLCAIFGVLVFFIFQDNGWDNLFVLPGAWLLTILYILLYCYFFCTGDIGWIAFGWSFDFLIYMYSFILPNIIYSLLLAVIYWGIRRKRIKNNLEREG